MDLSRSLARQSLVVAVVAALIDGVLLALCGVFAFAPWHTVAVLTGIVLSDLALAAPPRTAAVVAASQVAIRLVAAVLLHRHGFEGQFAGVGLLVAGYRAGAWLTGARSVLTMLLLCGGVACANVLAYHRGGHDWRLLVASMAAAGCVPWLVGRYTAARGAYIADLEQRERQRRQEHQVALERAVTEERAAIARDLHDVISHHVSAIGIHAGAARMALAGNGNGAATRSLAAVESSSRAAMVDLRRQLDLLHGRDDAGQRQPGLVDIDGLIEHVRAAGLTVEVAVRGTVVELPESLDVTVYRIVQEMLTNALRHGDGDHARLEVVYEPDRVLIRATNPIPRAPTAAETAVPRGLGGIRRRTELFDGELDYGPDAAGTSWHTAVSVPIGGA
ncbi:histidine kinase [Nocardia tenerifensis]|uniref:histidine kinase n=1 Tax=Nocardia tenerifensis TaxID=228006 RepID=A0A318K8Q3_9NOCA|nr:histidine kinase [Nocardia tenerifensis]PXX69094.1 histidine kinase [Nocardia tenerifensis]